jgi:hypothetical protein
MIPLGIMSFVEGLLGPKFGKFAKPLIYGVLGLLILASSMGREMRLRQERHHEARCEGGSGHRES